MTSKEIFPQCDVLFYITPSQEFIPVHDLNVPQRGVQITEKALKILKIRYLTTICVNVRDRVVCSCAISSQTA